MSFVQRTTRGFGSPGKYIQGPGEMDRLEQYTSAFGFNVVVLIDSYLFDTISERLRKVYEHTASKLHMEKFSGECTLKEIERITKTAEKCKSSVIVGIGGGKTQDTIKAAGAGLKIPIICVPTVASTDAPTSALSIIYTDEGVQTHCIYHKINPNVVLVDTEIIVKAPVRLLVSGMGDALSTYFEARANAESDTANYVGSGYRRTEAAMALARLCYEILIDEGLEAKLTAERGVITKALEDVIEANILLSGLGFENTGCAAGHAVNEGFALIPETHGFYHGEKVAFGTICQLILENRPKYEVEEVIKFCLSVGLPVTLQDLHIRPSFENLMIVANKVAMEGGLAHAEPFRVTPEIIYNSIAAADVLGGYYKELYKNQ
ncbi:glycerol dehydrogenase [Petroclostridium sp. X23]|uniref:glycerol dehydrogenase n=1 Tax=Petroclostridium sp. X23 TaxID=3045146 RepID=UPI0024AE1709|nr:glycerol dehydrogenase [Petroclostridium sp. X23]WHH60505.1 glycerol dehydrogenase [Petroclostridium sp. X23]